MFARNNVVTELGREVQREVSVGVSRMMECLDPTGKNNGMTASASDNMEGSSAGMPVRQAVEGCQVFPCPDSNSGSSLCGTSSGLSPQSLRDKSDGCISEASIKVRSLDLLFVPYKVSKFNKSSKHCKVLKIGCINQH